MLPRRSTPIDVVLTWHPVAFAISYVLISFTATPLPASALPRPLFLAIAVTLLLQGVLLAALRRRHAAALITSAVVLVSSAAWLALGIGAVVVSWWLLVSWRRRARGARPLQIGTPQVIRLFGSVAWIMAVFAAIPVISLLAASAAASSTGPAEPPDSDLPDIVVVLLDGYPRADALQRMGHDNSDFLAELERRGFETASEARANYTSTWATLASMFHGRYLDELPHLPQPYPEDAADQYRALMRLIREAPLLDPLRSRGYEIVTLPPTLEGAQLTAADRVIAPSQMTAFELSLIQRSPLGYLALSAFPSVAYDQHRARTQETLRLTVEELQVRSSRPRFVFSHVTSPHAPIVAAANGDPTVPPACFPSCSMYVFGSEHDWTRLPGHVQHLNDLVIDLVDSIMSSSTDATIVLMSDHGLRMPGAPEADLFRSLTSIRAPTAALSIPPDVQPTQILRLLTGEEVGSAPYEAWISEDERPLDIRPYDGPMP